MTLGVGEAIGCVHGYIAQMLYGTTVHHYDVFFPLETWDAGNGISVDGRSQGHILGPVLV